MSTLTSKSTWDPTLSASAIRTAFSNNFLAMDVFGALPGPLEESHLIHLEVLAQQPRPMPVGPHRAPPHTLKCVCVSCPPGLGAQSLACPLVPASMSQAVVLWAEGPGPRVGSWGGVTATTPAGESSHTVLQTCCQHTGFSPRKEHAVCREIGVAGLGGLVGPPPPPRPVPGALPEMGVQPMHRRTLMDWPLWPCPPHAGGSGQAFPCRGPHLPNPQGEMSVSINVKPTPQVKVFATILLVGSQGASWRPAGTGPRDIRDTFSPRRGS